MALLEIALFRFIISSNSASLTVEGGGPESRLQRDNTMTDCPHPLLLSPYSIVLLFNSSLGYFSNVLYVHFSSKTGFISYELIILA